MSQWNKCHWLGPAILATAISLVLAGCGGLGSSSSTNGGGPGGSPPPPPPPPSGSADVTVDFGNRSSGAASLAPGLFGSQLGLLNNAAAMQTLAQGGINSVRFYANVPDVFATPTPNWGLIDPLLQRVQAAGMHPILEVAYSPPWLQPTPNPCTGIQFSQPYNTAPSDVNQWANIAAQYVAHIDQTFPGLVEAYEIWNEPDEPHQFCTADSTITGRMNAYIALYAAAASAMHKQASSDGTQITVGGPALANPVGVASFWLPAMLNDPGAAPNVDFVSYHLYLAGAPDVGMTWDGAGGTPSLYQRTINGSTGEAAIYLKMAGLVQHGSQPNAAHTPIYFDEYNENWNFAVDCCRNSPVYSPVWNTMTVALLFNSTYQGATAPPARMIYYAASVPPFCLLGQIDAAMDCSSAVFEGYPQFYAYQLLAGSNYLGLSGGGTLARSLALSSAMAQAGLIATAFYTPSADAIVMVNPTGTDFSQVNVLAANPGFSGTAGTTYLLNSSNTQIRQQSVSLTATAGGVNATVSVPAFSVVAISIRGQ